MGKAIRDEGLGWGSTIIGGIFCAVVGWFLAFILTGAAISGISKAINSVKYIPDPAESMNLSHYKIIFIPHVSEMQMVI